MPEAFDPLERLWRSQKVIGNGKFPVQHNAEIRGRSWYLGGTFRPLRDHTVRNRGIRVTVAGDLLHAAQWKTSHLIGAVNVQKYNSHNCKVHTLKWSYIGKTITGTSQPSEAKPVHSIGTCPSSRWNSDYRLSMPRFSDSHSVEGLFDCLNASEKNRERNWNVKIEKTTTTHVGGACVSWGRRLEYWQRQQTEKGLTVEVSNVAYPCTEEHPLSTMETIPHRLPVLEIECAGSK